MAWEVEDSLTMRDVELLDVRFIPLARGLVEGAGALGLPFKVWETRRDHRRQAAYYAQGREVNGIKVPGPKITWAEPGESAHEWGFAIDLVLDIEGVSPWAGCRSFAEQKGRVKLSRTKLLERQKYEPYWQRLAAHARELGIVSGYNNWGWDWPHFQMKNWLLHRPADWRRLVALRLERAEGD